MKKITRLMLVFMLSVLLIKIAYAVNVNVEPTSIGFDNILIEGMSEKTLTIYTDSESPIFVSAYITGDIKNWVRLSSSTEFGASKSLPLIIKLTISPPKGIENKAYTGNLMLEVLNEEAPRINTYIGDNVFSIPIDVQVSSVGVNKINVKDLLISDTEVNRPLDIKTTIVNEGNVEAKQDIEVEIISPEGITDTIRLSYVAPPSEDEQTFNDNINVNLKQGEYQAKINVILDNVVIDEITRNFMVLGPGSLIKKINLIEIRNNDKAHINDKVKINAYFKNVGEVTTFAEFKGKIYSENNLVQNIESDRVYIPTNEVRNVVMEFVPTSIGEYKIVGQVLYEDTITDEKESAIIIIPVTEQLEPVPLATGVFIIVLLGLIILFVYFKKRV